MLNFSRAGRGFEIPLVAALLALVMPGSLLAQGRFAVIYNEPPAQFREVVDVVVGAGVVEEATQFVNSALWLPQEVPVVFDTCGMPNAFYDPEARRIVFCSEFLALFDQMFAQDPEITPEQREVLAAEKGGSHPAFADVPPPTCVLCKYRTAVVGFESEVGAVQESHHHHVEGQGANAPGSNVADCKLCDAFCSGMCRLQAADDHHHHHHDHHHGHDHHHHHDHDHHHHAEYPHAKHPHGPESARKGRA